MGSARQGRQGGADAATARAAPLKPAAALLLAFVTAACSDTARTPASSSIETADSGDVVAARVLERELARIRARANSIDDVFQPLPLLRPQQEAALQRFGNAQQLAVARRIGVAPDPTAEQLEAYVAERRLLRLADTTQWWIVRRLDYSAPYLTPDAHELLGDIGRRFHAALDALGLPRFRLEITSVLRTAADQEALRRVNPNAAQGASTHQYATTFDVAYSAFGPPAEPIVDPVADEAPWLEPHLHWIAGAAAETVAARRSRELMAVLGRVLLELQEDGRVMVTLERLQPVFHMTAVRP